MTEDRLTEIKFYPPMMKDIMIKIGTHNYRLLEKLTNAIGVSGDEGAVRKIVLDEVTPTADEVNVDALGNVLAIKKGSKPDCLKVMIAAKSARLWRTWIPMKVWD